MSQIVAGATETSGDGFQAGGVVITVHKATNIEKKGLVGKADPYVVVKYANQNEKSPTVNNDHNPVWHFTSSFKIDPSDKEVSIEVFDDDLGKDDFLGKAIIDVQSIINAKEFVNKQIPLEDCKTGELLISAKFVPLKKQSKPVGQISIILHKAKKVEKKKMMKKANPYVIIKLGNNMQKSKTVNNSQKHEWKKKSRF